MATYTVKEGDTLSEIANKYNLTTERLAKKNNISNPNMISVGQLLNIEEGATDDLLSKATLVEKESTTPEATTPNGTESTAPKFNYGSYAPSDAVNQAQQLLNQQLTQKPGEYQSQWGSQLNDIVQQILNRDKFSYDLNADALYQQYKDQYVTQGKLAMMDTMGQAQAMTGGYGNSYAQSVGQQAYQAYLQKLNEVVPELYGMALDQYNQEGQNLLNQFAILGEQEDKEYGRYMDNMNAWLSERDYLAGRYDTERDYDYGMWSDGRDFSYGQFMDDLAFQYQQDRDKISDEQWQKEFDEAQRQFNKLHGVSSGGSSGGSSSGSSKSSGSSSSSSSSGYNNSGYSATVVKNAQAFVGASADGKWGSNSAAAAKAKGYNSLADVVTAMQNSVKNGTTSTGSTSTKPSASAYSGWSAGTWEAYFAKIRQTEGQAAAIAELNYFTTNGLIPKNMVTYASSGARGGQMGH